MQNFDFKSCGIGLLIGLVIALLVFCVMMIQKSIQKKAAKKQIDDLKNMLSNRMDIESTGLTSVKAEIEALKKQNENMRVTLSTLDQKPGRKEMKRLQVYQTAVEKLMISSPGFAAAWQVAVGEAEKGLKEASVGSIPFIGKFITDKNSAELSLDKN